MPTRSSCRARRRPASGCRRSSTWVPVQLGPSIGSDLLDLRDRIDARRETGDLSKREARALRREARQIEALTERYGRDGLSDSERREIDMRTQALRGLAGAPVTAANGK
ncbi:hypothetical protein [Sphingopyxis sp. PET50]|uniref:hypothetical protein n=1 Tax=Sphingopyxis sp. PET50 TaxID=2976533 RepID=UPI0021B06EE6|nr:hypothetical protein [Sphingopyxis sp. PET50]